MPWLTRACTRPKHGSPSTSVRLLNTSASVYVSRSRDPHFNLSFEDWLFRRKQGPEYALFLYRNAPSVIIGRNQNPWKEINLARLRELGIPFVRRRSGGGTVYHDLGNTNYCVLTPRSTFDRKSNAAMMARALRQLGIPAYVNERHDICVEDFKMGLVCFSLVFKAHTYLLHVSGSAFKLTSNRAYHHGTMLIDADLQALRGLLKSDKNITGKSIASISSPVQNLEHWSANIDHEAFVDAAVEHFGKQYNVALDNTELVDESFTTDLTSIAKGTTELESWEWKYGQTPEFTHSIREEHEGQSIELEITSKHGLITSMHFVKAPDALRRLEGALIGDRYGTLERTLDSSAAREAESDSWLQWLRSKVY